MADQPSDQAPARTSEFVAAPGGVMTDEVGVITGELTLRTEADVDGWLISRVQYRDAAEWYVVTGSRHQPPPDTDLAAAIDKAHADLMGRLGVG